MEKKSRSSQVGHAWPTCTWPTWPTWPSSPTWPTWPTWPLFPQVRILIQRAALSFISITRLLDLCFWELAQLTHLAWVKWAKWVKWANLGEVGQVGQVGVTHLKEGRFPRKLAGLSCNNGIPQARIWPSHLVAFLNRLVTSEWQCVDPYCRTSHLMTHDPTIELLSSCLKSTSPRLHKCQPRMVWVDEVPLDDRGQVLIEDKSIQENMVKFKYHWSLVLGSREAPLYVIIFVNIWNLCTKARKDFDICLATMCSRLKLFLALPKLPVLDSRLCCTKLVWREPFSFLLWFCEHLSSKEHLQTKYVNMLVNGRTNAQSPEHLLTSPFQFFFYSISH